MRIKIKLALLFLVVNCQSIPAQIDSARLDSYLILKAAYDKTNAERDSISFEAMNRIFDLSYSEVERIAYVMLLSEIGTDTCIRFLISNNGKRIYHGEINGDYDMAKGVIFFTALYNVQDKWKIVSAVIDMLDGKIEEKQFPIIASLFAEKCGNYNIARMILESQYRGTSEPRRHNINKLLSILPPP